MSIHWLLCVLFCSLIESGLHKWLAKVKKLEEDKRQLSSKKALISSLVVILPAWSLRLPTPFPHSKPPHNSQ